MLACIHTLSSRRVRQGLRARFFVVAGASMSRRTWLVEWEFWVAGVMRLQNRNFFLRADDGLGGVDALWRGVIWLMEFCLRGGVGGCLQFG